ncbi:MAG: fused MFS/spermidine synthase [Betaproteobacteria bacterium]|nr:fused MFS/spermidine synthase [Betaproteobacteria bacterium]
MLLHAGTIFLSAFLLFLVQPIIAKQILPWFGGAASVWATCLVFFQTVLLFGYAYADWTSRYLTPRRQAWLHVALLAVSLALLPIIPDAGWKPGGDSGMAPTLAILGLLATTIGLQYFLVSTTSPLVQAWYWRRFRHVVPYRLFALSNFASLLALLAYPVLIEPVLPLAAQALSWSAAYAVFAVLCAATAIVSALHARTAAPDAAAEPAAGVAERAPTPGERWLWIGLSATGSCLLLAVTNHLTQNIASIPFLWVVPLSLYLVTFILCFDHPRWYQRTLFIPLVAVLVPVMAGYGTSLDLWVAAPIYAAGLFVCCMFCHGELYLLKPGPRYLTTFYLMISLGGALGALLIGVAAPNFLPGYYELEITLIACALLLFGRMLKGRWWIAGGAFAAVAATATLAAHNFNHYFYDTRVMMRNFYGVVRTRDFPDPVPFRAMYHGSIKHGGQLLDAAWQNQPTAYFGPTSAYGRVFASLPEAPRRVGIVGLGAGVIAAYARREDVFRFYEIDPQVAAVAMTEFSFLRNSPAQVEIVLGDGRLSLEREPNQQYDLLALDAFSGDSIPMHLLTREAMATYLRHLKPDGVIVFQATNRFVDIAPVVERLAAEFGFTAVLVSDTPEGRSDKSADYWLADTDQIIFTRNTVLLAAEPIRSGAEPLMPRPAFPVWTDDFYNLLRILK